MIIEKWKSIKDFNNYEISEFGVIKSKEHYVRTPSNGLKFIRSKIIKQHKDKNGYKTVILEKNDKLSTHYVHQLVANNFITKREFDNLLIKHKDGNIENNYYLNLTWVKPKIKDTSIVLINSDKTYLFENAKDVSKFINIPERKIVKNLNKYEYYEENNLLLYKMSYFIKFIKGE
jgi:hypothetical protein